MDGSVSAYPYRDSKLVADALLREVFTSEAVRVEGEVKFGELWAEVLRGVREARVRDDAWEVLKSMELKMGQHGSWLKKLVTERLLELVSEGRITYGHHRGGYKGVKSSNNQFIGYFGNHFRTFIEDWEELKIIPISCIHTALRMTERVFMIWKRFE